MGPILSDYNLPAFRLQRSTGDFDGKLCLSSWVRLNGEDISVQAMRQRANDYLLKATSPPAPAAGWPSANEPIAKQVPLRCRSRQHSANCASPANHIDRILRPSPAKIQRLVAGLPPEIRPGLVARQPIRPISPERVHRPLKPFLTRPTPAAIIHNPPTTWSRFVPAAMMTERSAAHRIMATFRTSHDNLPWPPAFRWWPPFCARNAHNVSKHARLATSRRCLDSGACCPSK